MIVTKNYMHYFRNTTIPEKHISLSVSMDRWNTKRSLFSHAFVWNHANPCEKLPSQIAMIDLGSQYDDLRLNHLSLVELVEGQRSNNYLSAKKL
jgi:hypothetical protein